MISTRNTFAGIALTFVIASVGQPALAAATADKRPAGFDFKPNQHYCVKNAESGACEDCWSGSMKSSRGGTCKELKEATTQPTVRKGRCSEVVNTDFCKSKAR